MDDESFESSGQGGVRALLQNYFSNQSIQLSEVVISSGDNSDPDVSASDDHRTHSEHQQVKMAVLRKLLAGEQLTYTEKSMGLAAVIVSCGGLIFGYELGAMAGSLAQLQQHFSMNSGEEGQAVAILYAGQMLGGGLAGVLTDSIGRWRTCQIQTFIFAIGSLVLGTSHSLLPVLVGRFFIGIAAAFAAISAVPYLREIAPHRYGGRFASTYEVFVVVGILLANIISLFVYDKQGSWRHIFLLPVAFAAVQAAAMWFVPESPSWLVQKGFTERATLALRRIYNDPEVVMDELNALKLINLTKSYGRFHTVVTVLRQYRYLLLIVVMVSLFNGLCGGSVFIAYLPLIFESHTDVGTLDALIMNACVGVVRLLATIASISLLDSARGGRRFLLLIGVALICVGQLLLAVSFLRSDQFPHINYMYVAGTCITVAGQGAGFGIVTSLLQTEMFPTLVRARAMSVAMTAQNLALYLVNYSFPRLIDLMGAETLFFSYTIAAVVALIVVFTFVPETKGKRPAEILASVVQPIDPMRQTETGASLQVGESMFLPRTQYDQQNKACTSSNSDGEQVARMEMSISNPMQVHAGVGADAAAIADVGGRSGEGMMGAGQTPPVVTIYPGSVFLARATSDDSEF